MCRAAGAVFVGSENFAEEANDCPKEATAVANVVAGLRRRVGCIRCIGYVINCCSATIATIVIIAVDVAESRNF